MIPYYEELNDEEKNAVTKVIRTLLKQTFVLERKYDKKSGRLVYNKEFRTIDLHQEFLREYFKISGIELRENLHLGVFYIEGETLIGEKISRLSTIYLLILKLLYDEHMAEASSNTSVYTSLGEIHEKINDFHLMRTLPSITEMRRSIALLKKYQIIEPLDVLEELNEETRMMIYPCVNVVLLGDDIRRLIESFSKEEVDSEFDEEATAKKKESMISQKQEDYYNDILDGWKEEVKWTLNEKEWAKVNFDDHFKQPETDNTEAADESIADTESVNTTEAE